MRISQVKLKGFRNFKDAVITFTEKTLLIGSNDIGKSNLLFALRILLDKSLSDIDIEPHDSDFYAYEQTNEIIILIKFIDVIDDCIVAKLKGYISDTDEMYLAYHANRDPNTGAKTYQFLMGPAEDQFQEITERYYRKVLNMKYIGSNRDLYSFIRKEKRDLMQYAKQHREQPEIDYDTKSLKEIETSLKKVNNKVASLNFIKNATHNINKELSELSFHHSTQEVIFDIGTSDTNKVIENIQLASQVNGKNLAIGGDGRNNQIFLALWAAKNEVQDVDPLEVVIYCIEEPEAHLHPHQQRKLAEYLYKVLKGQVIITTHSPHITSEFSPKSIIRLHKAENDYSTIAANQGCSHLLNDVMIEFGHRMDVISAEAFFASCVFLVEGQSEVLFYKALAPQIGIDLDKLNVSILMVDGVGFKPYIKLLNALNIYWIMRTDNDIFQIPKKDAFRFAGVQRAIQLYKEYCYEEDDIKKVINSKKDLLTGFKIPIPKKQLTAAKAIIKKLKKYDIFLADVDLETDLFNSEIQEDIKAFFEKCDATCSDEEYISFMQDRKATFMFEFLCTHQDCLAKLVDNDIALPLKACEEATKRI